MERRCQRHHWVDSKKNGGGLSRSKEQFFSTSAENQDSPTEQLSRVTGAKDSYLIVSTLLLGMCLGTTRFFSKYFADTWINIIQSQHLLTNLKALRPCPWKAFTQKVACNLGRQRSWYTTTCWLCLQPFCTCILAWMQKVFSENQMKHEWFCWFYLWLFLCTSLALLCFTAVLLNSQL